MSDLDPYYTQADHAHRYRCGVRAGTMLRTRWGGFPHRTMKGFLMEGPRLRCGAWWAKDRA